jgi:hypothetical protein
MSEVNFRPAAEPAAAEPSAPPSSWVAPELRRWVAPAVRELPPLTHLTLVSGIIGPPIGGGCGGFGEPDCP